MRIEDCNTWAPRYMYVVICHLKTENSSVIANSSFPAAEAAAVLQHFLIPFPSLNCRTTGQAWQWQLRSTRVILYKKVKEKRVHSLKLANFLLLLLLV